MNVNSDIIPVSRPSHKLVLPFVKSIQQYKTHLKHFNTDLIFTYKNKFKNQLVHNKPPASIKRGVYSIPCNDCNKSYIGETGRDLKIRIKEHKKDVLEMKQTSDIAQYVCKMDHWFNFNKANIIFESSNQNIRRIVESAVISLKSKKDLTINQNMGFSPRNDILSHYITHLIRDFG